ncbi:MAG TPA: hypothetical protein PK794_07415 [Armatimonadota bacterium]|nr:hypothetical protein [Armatimonadota bacterium]
MLVALSAWLGLVLLGSYPHQHAHGHAPAAHASSPALLAADDDCSLCAWHAAASSCAALALPTVTPRFNAADPAHLAVRISSASPALLRATRAPPTPRA